MTIKDILDKAGKSKKKSDPRKTAKNIAISASIGSLIGLAAGILFAPKSGKQTREQLSKNAKNAAETLKKNIAKAKEKMQKAETECCSSQEQSAQEEKSE